MGLNDKTKSLVEGIVPLARTIEKCDGEIWSIIKGSILLGIVILNPVFKSTAMV